LRLYLTAVGFYDRPDAIQTETVMTLAGVPERLAPPILCGRIKSNLWFVQSE
jgi:hypothetical protein